MSHNVLAQRLSDLEQAGVVVRHRLGPPSSVWVYELTSSGRQLEPVLIALGQWGSRLSVDASTNPHLSVDALVFALKTTFDAEAAGALRGTCQLRLGEDTFHAQVTDGGFRIARGEAPAADVTITADAPTLQTLVFDERPLADAEQAGEATVAGNRQVADHLRRCFRRTVPFVPEGRTGSHLCQPPHRTSTA